MSVKEVMQIQEMIDNSMLSAGATDFSKVLFSRSSANYIATQYYTTREFIMGKFIVPLDGIYKITFEYRHFYTSGTNKRGEVHCWLKGGSIRPCVGSYGSGSSGSYSEKITGSMIADDYVNAAIGDDFSTVFTNSNYVKVRTLLELKDPPSSTAWIGYTGYAYLEKGEGFVINGNRFPYANGDTLNLQFRNFKITY